MLPLFLLLLIQKAFASIADVVAFKNAVKATHSPIEKRLAACAYLQTIHVVKLDQEFHEILQDQLSGSGKLDRSVYPNAVAVLEDARRVPADTIVVAEARSIADLDLLLNRIESQCSFLDQDLFMGLLHERNAKAKAIGAADQLPKLSQRVNMFLEHFDGRPISPRIFEFLQEMKVSSDSAVHLTEKSTRNLFTSAFMGRQETSEIIAEIVCTETDAAYLRKFIENAWSIIVSSDGKNMMLANLLASIAKHQHIAITPILIKTQEVSGQPDFEDILARTVQILAVEEVASNNLRDIIESRSTPPGLVITPEMKTIVDQIDKYAEESFDHLANAYTDDAFFGAAKETDLEAFLATRGHVDWAKRVAAAKFIRKNMPGIDNLKAAVAAAEAAGRFPKVVSWLQDHKSKVVIDENISDNHLGLLEDQMEDSTMLGHYDVSSYFRVLQLRVGRSFHANSTNETVLKSTIDYVNGTTSPISDKYHKVLSFVCRDQKVLQAYLASYGDADFITAVTSITKAAADKRKSGRDLASPLVNSPADTQKRLIVSIDKAIPAQTEQVFVGLLLASPSKAILGGIVRGIGDAGLTAKYNAALAIIEREARIAAFSPATAAIHISNQVAKINEEIFQASYSPESVVDSYFRIGPETPILDDHVRVGDVLSVVPLELLTPLLHQEQAEGSLGKPAEVAIKEPVSGSVPIDAKSLDNLSTAQIEAIPLNIFGQLPLGFGRRFVPRIPLSHLGSFLNKMSGEQCSYLTTSQISYLEANEDLKTRYHEVCLGKNNASSAQFLASWIFTAGLGLVGMIFFLV